MSLGRRRVPGEQDSFEEQGVRVRALGLRLGLGDSGFITLIRMPLWSVHSFVLGVSALMDALLCL